MKTKQRTFRLASTEMVHAPGLLRWAMNGAKFKKDRPKMRNVMKSWPTDLTDKEWDGVLLGTIPHTIEGDVVVITL
jgi:hypothetical protein